MNIASREELQRTLDLIHDSDMRAIKMWREAHPGNELVWPDRAEMIFWLLELRKAAEAAVHALRSYQYGNAGTRLAKEAADHLEAAIKGGT